MKKSSKPKSVSVVRCAAFLRAVNVGGRTVKSPQLVEAITSLGFRDATPFMASGNVIFDYSTTRFDAHSVAEKLEKGLAESLGFRTEVFLRSLARLAEIANLNPFQLSESEQADYTVNVSFLLEPPSAKMQKDVKALATDYDAFSFAEQEMFWLCRGKKMSDSVLFEGNKLPKAMNCMSTMRNMRTIERIVKKFGK